MVRLKFPEPKMRGATILIALISSSLLGQVLCDSKSFKNFAGLKFYDEIKVDDLMDLLSREIKEKFTPWYGSYGKYKSAARQVASLLARAADKATPKTILDEFSVNDLLALNKCKPADCTKVELDGRRAVCERLSILREHEKKVDAQVPGLFPFKSVSDNLLKYCEAVVEGCEKFCADSRWKIANRKLRRIEYADRARIGVLVDKVYLYTWHRVDKASIDYEAIIALVLESEKQPAKTNLLSACKAFVEITATIPQYNDGQLPNRQDIVSIAYKYCRIAVRY